MVKQDAVTVAAEVRLGRIAALQRVLQQVGAKVDSDGGIFRAMNAERPHVHFARWVLLTPTTAFDGRPRKPQLIYAADVDRGEEPHLESLVRHRRGQIGGVSMDVLHQIYQHTTDYHGPLSDAEMVRHLNAKRIRTQTFYVNKRGRTVEEVWREEELRSRIEAFLGDGLQWSSTTAREARNAVRGFVQSDPDLRWALQSGEPARPLTRLVQASLRRVVRVAVLGLERLGRSSLVPALLDVTSPVERDLRGRPVLDHVPGATIEALDERDDHGAVHSPFSVVGQVRPRFGRVALTRFAFAATHVGARYIFNDSDLAGVKSIHFARWVFVESDRAMFCSTYDGSMENYNSDFVDKVAWGLNFTFGRGVGYPRTWVLVWRGAEHELKFRQVIRNRQGHAPTCVWYSAYPKLTALNLKINHAIRQGLVGEMDEPAACAWLSLF